MPASWLLASLYLAYARRRRGGASSAARVGAVGAGVRRGCPPGRGDRRTRSSPSRSARVVLADGNIFLFGGWFMADPLGCVFAGLIARRRLPRRPLLDRLHPARRRAAARVSRARRRDLLRLLSSVPADDDAGRDLQQHHPHVGGDRGNDAELRLPGRLLPGQACARGRLEVRDHLHGRRGLRPLRHGSRLFQRDRRLRPTRRARSFGPRSSSTPPCSTSPS